MLSQNIVYTKPNSQIMVHSQPKTSQYVSKPCVQNIAAIEPGFYCDNP